MSRKIVSLMIALLIFGFTNVITANSDGSPQWVTGEVVFIQEGAADSLVSVRMPDNTVFNIASSNDKLMGIKVGDRVVVKVFQGWAQSALLKAKINRRFSRHKPGHSSRSR